MQPTRPSPPTAQQLDRLLDRLPEFRQAAVDIKEMLLANLVMIGEIPSPTFQEENRSRFLQDRFSECGMVNCSSDEVHNALGILHGRDGSESERHILVVAHTDTPAENNEQNKSISVTQDYVTGSGVADNSLGLVAVATLPTLLERLGVQLRSNLVLMGSSRSLGRGDLGGLRFFLDNKKLPIHYGMCVEGVQLGRLSYNSIGMCRGEIIIEVPEDYDMTRFGASSVVRTLNRILVKIDQIPLPAQPQTTIVINSLHSDGKFNMIPTRATIRFELRSESADMVHFLLARIRQITEELAALTQAHIHLELIAQREPGGIPYAHPLVQTARDVMERLKIEPVIQPSMSELVAFIQKQIPAVTLGLTTGKNIGKTSETVHIEPMFDGMAQMVAVLLAMDEGLCDAD